MRHETPTVITLDERRLRELLGPSLSCTGFAGGVKC